MIKLKSYCECFAPKSTNRNHRDTYLPRRSCRANPLMDPHSQPIKGRQLSGSYALSYLAGLLETTSDALANT